MTTDSPGSAEHPIDSDTGTTSVATAPPPPPISGEAGHPDEPVRPRAGLVALLVALGVGLLAAALAVSTYYSRFDGELDWSNYAVGLGTTAGLLLVALGVGVMVRRKQPATAARYQVVTWAGAVGIVGVGAMIAVGVDTGDYLGYLIGGVVVALSAVGFLLTRGGAFVVTAILGLGMLYAQAFGDVFGDSLDEERAVSVIAVAIAVFVVGVTVLGWLLPTRVLSALVAGWLGVVGLTQLLVVVVTMQLFRSAFGGSSGLIGPDDPPMGFEGGEVPTDGMGGALAGDADTDVWVILAIAGGLAVMWAVGAALTDRSGFILLAVVLPAAVAPLGAFALAADQPTWWGVALAVPGGILLALAALLARRRGKRSGDHSAG